MKKLPELTKRNLRQQLIACLIIGVFVGLLLSACNAKPSASTKQGGTATPVPTPTISETMVNEGNTQLQTFQQWITLMQQYKGDVKNYQKQYNDDQQALNNSHTDKEYNAVLTNLANHISAIEVPALKAEAISLRQTLADKVSAWQSQHTYHDDYNGQDYPYGYEYTDGGAVGYDLSTMSTAQTPKDYQQIIEDFNTYLTNFQAMTDNANDTTPSNQIHKTDTQLMQKYGAMQGKVVVISLHEQDMRVYNNGQLVNAFLVTTGTMAHPSLPGLWWVEVKQSPTVFKSFLQPGQPGYYPPTPVKYAMQYHSEGYNLHDSWWRNDYGPGTQFPHADSSGNQSAYEGSHGCVNIQEDNAHWLYDFVDLNTPVIVY
jgi:hypothetical protein